MREAHVWEVVEGWGVSTADFQPSALVQSSAYAGLPTIPPSVSVSSRFCQPMTGP